MQGQDRRNATTERVIVETLVEMCGLDAGVAPAFEAESVNVSGRGMQVRTAYLPEVGTPLVCRLEHQGNEIIVEGSVVWRRDEPAGGEFGLKFSAVDSSSVDALKRLCGLQQPEPEEAAAAEPEPPPEPEPMDDPDLPSPPPPPNVPGSRVKLHIEGLGSPMRARVRDSGKRRVHVGSNLEFLAVGKQLELENLDQEMKRTARIDAIDVVIDPQTQIPQLVVALHYDDVEEIDDTPQPSVIDTAEYETPVTPLQPFGIAIHDTGGLPAFEQAEACTDSPLGLEPEPAPEPEREAAAADAEDDLEVAGLPETPLPLKVGRVAAGAAKNAGSVMSRVGAEAATGMRRIMQGAVRGAGTRVRDIRDRRSATKAPRRVTAQHPDGPLSVEGARLRAQSQPPSQLRRQGAPPVEGETKQPRFSRRRKAMIGGASAALLVTVGVMAMANPKPPPGAEQPAQAATVEVSVNEDVTEVDEQGNPAPKIAKVTKLEEPKASSTGVVADVPLFGPTPLATMEPAPLGPSPDGDPASAKTKPADEQFDDEPTVRRKQADPKSVKPWGRGRMHKPVIHRLRLDSPGAAIDGAIHPTGFSVVVPGRKVMESGKPIAQRDKRISRVKTQNSSSGGQVTFTFRGGVPGYRVRLRKDFVEILISSPKDK